MTWHTIWGKVFRKMGLPAWTFAGVGIASIWFGAFGSVVERGIRDVLRIDQDSALALTYIPSLVLIAVPFLIVFVAARFLPRSGVTILGQLQKPRQKKGLILLVSKVESAMEAVKYHFALPARTLQHVWLIPSNDCNADCFGKNSRQFAEDISAACKKMAADAGTKLAVEVHHSGVAPGDAQDTYDYVNRIYRQGPFGPSEIIADFTGGTKPMSVGMIMACLPAERELEYVAYNPNTGVMHGPFLIDYQHSAFDLIG